MYPKQKHANVSRSIVRLCRIAFHGIFLAALSLKGSTTPARILSSSLGETCGWSSGASRETRYQAMPANIPIAAHNQKDARHPYPAMMATNNGGVNPAPAPTPAKM